jgi:hypothetical protein
MNIGPDHGFISRRSTMAVPLRLYRSPEDSLPRLRGESGMDELFDAPAPEPSVRVSLRDLVPLVAMAQRMQFLWLKDFLDDEIVVTEDLYQVLQSFRSIQPTAA